MNKEQAIEEINKVFEPSFANYIITALTEGATVSDKKLEHRADWHDVPSNEMTLEQARQAVRDLRKKLAEHLEQESCEDAVSRQAVLNLFNKSDEYSWGMSLIKRKIEEMPPATPTQKWIPCSERLPKEGGFYLVSTTDCITIMEFIGGWISQNLGSCNWYVKAWQPLPKPYKEKESEE